MFPKNYKKLLDFGSVYRCGVMSQRFFVWEKSLNLQKHVAKVSFLSLYQSLRLQNCRDNSKKQLIFQQPSAKGEISIQ